MKKSILAIGIAVIALVGAGSVSAQMVDIGSGQMEQSEFMALKAMVQGQQTGGVPLISTPLARPERYGMVEMTHTEIEALRDTMAGRSTPITETKPVQMVTIGTGEMPMDEFIVLKKMVEKTDTFNMDQLMARLR